MVNFLNLGDLTDAISFAAQKHQGQTRKDAQGSPYITHPIAVATAIAEIGKVADRNILIAAILHDTLEDTQTRPHEIRSAFGEEILSFVQEVSDDKSKPKMERKRLQVVHAPGLSHPARIIKIADKLVNCRDILNTPPKEWTLERKRGYIQWAEDVVCQIRGTNPGLETAYEKMLMEAEEKFAFKIQPFETIDDRPWSPNNGPYTEESPNE
jgi:guanosine-3',5'-bis(diphosphate) 3'-pyrophosphohydrolase